MKTAYANIQWVIQRNLTNTEDSQAKDHLRITYDRVD